jgi:murein DD-endopeptidase MepM/ murein hydrolase activator NlpD
VHPSQQRAPARKPQAAIILARNGKIRTFKVRPGLVALVFGGFAAFSTAYLVAAAYFVFRDDLLTTTLARQVDMQYAYEDRIAALRAELDRVASRHAVETLGVEEQLALLLDRQALIAERQGTLDTLVERADEAGLAVAAVQPPRRRPVLPSDSAGTDAAPPLAYAPGEDSVEDIVTGALPSANGVGRESARPFLRDVRSSLDDIEDQQSGALDALSAAAANEAERIERVLAPLDIEPEAVDGPQGGPFIAPGELHFAEKAALLSRALQTIAGLRDAAAEAPLAEPLAGASMSSRFGYRIDPFLRRPALHAGIDFAAAAGTTVRATAAGVVTIARRSGGYGKLVEIRHANGLATRYGHLSVIVVREGDRVAAGAPIGRVGSTGRSTGPHLHYETRRDGEPVDPRPFLAAGREL